jgi:RNA polymerase sigma-70 factor, ECF subfamily
MSNTLALRFPLQPTSQPARAKAPGKAKAPAPAQPGETEIVRIDRKLVLAAQKGDADAFRQLVVRHQRKAYAVALGMVHDPDDARDICQDAFMKAHKSLASFEGDAQFFTWLYRIVANLAIDHLRKKKRLRVEFDEAVLGEGNLDDDSGISPRRLGFDPARALADGELRERLEAALAQLSPAHRAVLVMREVDGLSYQEMADVVGCSIGTIMSRLFHARKKMQALLGGSRQGE